MRWSGENWGAYGGIPIVESGNGRIYRMRPELQALHAERATELAAKRHGNFVLINTNLGLLNHFYAHLSALPSPEQFGLGATGWLAGLRAILTLSSEHFWCCCRALPNAFPKRSSCSLHSGENHDIGAKLPARHPISLSATKAMS